jgi:hypothetical protein
MEERLKAEIGEVLSNPHIQEFHKRLLRRAHDTDTEFRAHLRIKGDPFATAENHAWADGAVEGLCEAADALDSPESFLLYVKGGEDE